MCFVGYSQATLYLRYNTPPPPLLLALPNKNLIRQQHSCCVQWSLPSRGRSMTRTKRNYILNYSYFLNIMKRRNQEIQLKKRPKNNSFGKTKYLIWPIYKRKHLYHTRIFCLNCFIYPQTMHGWWYQLYFETSFGQEIIERSLCLTLSVRIPSYGCTCKVGRAREKS